MTIQWKEIATIVALSGLNLKDSGGNDLDDEDVRNSDLSLAYSGTNIQIKKGSTQIGSNLDAPDALKNAEIADTDLYGSGKVWASLPASGANNYTLPTDVMKGTPTISGTTISIPRNGASTVTLTTQDTNTWPSGGSAGQFWNNSGAWSTPPDTDTVYTLPGDVLKGTITVSGTTVTIPKNDGGTYTITTQDTNTTYSAGDFNITGLAGYSAAAYANASLGWGAITVTAGSMVESWSTEDQSAYLPNTTTQTGTLTIVHPSTGQFDATYTWTRTGLNITGFALSNTGSGNDAWTFGDGSGQTDNAFGSNAASKFIYVQHTASSKELVIQAFVTDLSNLGGCLLPGSMIKHSNGETPIEEIEVGTKVIAYDVDNNKEVEAEILDKAPHKADFYYKVNDLKLTSGHPIWANDSWSCVDPVEYKRECIAYGHTLDLEPNKLEIGDVLYDKTLVEKIERVDETTEVWNIIIKDIHTYIANGILVHNGGGGGGGKCLTPAMLPEDLKVGDYVDSPEGKTKVVDIIYKQREGYYILENELEITNDHPILWEGEWIEAEEYPGNKEYIEGYVDVVYVETENELLTVKGWTVGGKY